MGKNNKDVDGSKKRLHHGKLGQKLSKRVSDKEKGPEVVDRYDFERYCGQCDFFMDEKKMSILSNLGRHNVERGVRLRSVLGLNENNSIIRFTRLSSNLGGF